MPKVHVIVEVGRFTAFCEH